MNSDLSLLPPFSVASVLVRSFYNQGLRYAIVSPGSRSTPLTMALAHHPGIQKYVILDERSAAFIALGIGKATGKPALLVCTSGTAVANYMPAVTEAGESGVPMVICSADRPPSLRGTGSNQTVDQIKLFGEKAVWFHEMGEPANTPRDIRRIEFSAQQAVRESVTKNGASHINIPFRKPLEPALDLLSRYKNEAIMQVKNEQRDNTAYTKEILPGKRILDQINTSVRPLLIAGPSHPFQSQINTVVQLSETLSAPVIAEPGSGMPDHPNRISGFEQFLRDTTSAEKVQPDLILRFGDQPFTKSILTAMELWKEVPVIRVDARDDWQDHQMNSSEVIKLQGTESLSLEHIPKKTEDKWLKSWSRLSFNASNEKNTVLKEETVLCDGHVFDYIARNLPESWNLMISNSLPVRDAALFGWPESSLFVNRGAAGIDGILSTAAGVALASDQITCCIVGDLAFLHDSNALLTLNRSKAPVVVVVVNNGGGSIFRMLPVQNQEDIFTTYFETPHSPDLRHLANAHHIPFQRVTNIDELTNLKVAHLTRESLPLIVECVTDPEKSMAMRKCLWAV